MIPAQPPFPTASNFWFQVSAGSQISIAISESDDGFSSAATRQNAGTIRRPGCAGPGWVGGLNSPAGTSSAIVIVVLGNESDFRPAHGVAASAAPTRRRATLAIKIGRAH